MIKQILHRFFSNDTFKGTYKYIDTQKKYEIARTIIYFGLSLSIFAMGYITTKTRVNLLTIVAVLGFLPASKSLVEMILYLKFKSCSEENAKIINERVGDLCNGFDFVFTSYNKNFTVSHITVVGNTICGFTEDSKFEEQAFYKHITDILKLDNYKDTSIKIFSDINKYSERLKALNEFENINSKLSLGIMKTLKSVAL